MKTTLVALSLAALLAASAGAQIILDTTGKSIELETSAAVSTDYYSAYADITTTAFTPGASDGNVASATTTTIIAAPGASTQRQVKWISIRNRSTTAAQTVTIKLDVSATERHLTGAHVLSAGESMKLDSEGVVTVYDANGRQKVAVYATDGYSGQTLHLQKTGTAKDAAGYWIAHAKDAGQPGAYSLGSPGLNGFNTDCGTASNATNPVGASQVGSFHLQDPATGAWYLTRVGLAGSQAELIHLVDPLWYNTGIVVTTTTAQTITMPGALPARDVNGSTNGEGVMAALLTTTANTNAAVITNTTISYTDSDGNAGNTGTFSGIVGRQAPATPVIGTWMPFQLAAGDRGIRSVQSITLGTSYGAGALSLILYRPLATIPNPVANVGGIMTSTPFAESPGVRLYNDTCIWALTMGAANAATLAGSLSVMER